MAEGILKIVISFSLVYTPTWALLPNGRNVCMMDESVTTMVRVEEPYQYTRRKTRWCFKIPPRCSKYETVWDWHWVDKEVTETRTVPKCCVGYVAGSTDVDCRPSCSHPCKHGVCSSPNKCTCEAGYKGRLCESACPRGNWGVNCAGTCLCRNGAFCDPVSGSCDCTIGWLGHRCDEPCKPGYHGIDCALQCSCGEFLCHHITGDCIYPTSTTELTTTPFSTTTYPPTTEISTTPFSSTTYTPSTTELSTTLFTTTELSTTPFSTTTFTPSTDFTTSPITTNSELNHSWSSTQATSSSADSQDLTTSSQYNSQFSAVTNTYSSTNRASRASTGLRSVHLASPYHSTTPASRFKPESDTVFFDFTTLKTENFSSTTLANFNSTSDPTIPSEENYNTTMVAEEERSGRHELAGLAITIVLSVIGAIAFLIAAAGVIMSRHRKLVTSQAQVASTDIGIHKYYGDENLFPGKTLFNNPTYGCDEEMELHTQEKPTLRTFTPTQDNFDAELREILEAHYDHPPSVIGNLSVSVEHLYDEISANYDDDRTGITAFRTFS